MIPRLKPALGISEFIAAMRLPGKNDLEEFERYFALSMDQKHAVAFPYGRTGLIFLLEALGLRDKEIICPAYTCVVVPHATVYSGNKPVFIDCGKDDFNMDLAMAEEAITEKTGAIIATSLFGYPVDLDRLDRIKKAHPDIRVIQDCAHSFAAEWKNRPVQKAGDAALFGLNISKMITSIFGGIVTTDDGDLAARIALLRRQKLKKASFAKSAKRFLYLIAIYAAFSESTYRFVNYLERSEFLDPYVQYFDERRIDMPDDYLESLCSVEARVGIVNLLRYNNLIARRRAAAEYYFNHLKNTDEFKLPPEHPGATYSHFVVQVSDRKKWLEKGLESGIQLGQLIEYSIPEMSAYGLHSLDEFPMAGRFSRHTINLPVWGGAELAERIIKRLM